MGIRGHGALILRDSLFWAPLAASHSETRGSSGGSIFLYQVGKEPGCGGPREGWVKGRKWRLDLPALLKKTPAQKGVAEWGAAAVWKQGRS